MDIIFWTGIYGSIISRPIGVYQLAHWMRKNGYECQVIDFVQHMPALELVEFTEKFITGNTLCLGLSSTFWSVYRPDQKRWRMIDAMPQNLYNALLIIKKRYPHIKIILGGSQSDVQPDEVYKLFDVVITGNGEDTLLEICNEFRKGRKTIFSATNRAGTPYLSGSFNKVFDMTKNDHLYAPNDCIVPGETLPMEVSRGCIFSCKFCQYPHIGKKKNDYIREMDLLKQEIEYNKKMFNCSNYFILDDTFNDSHEKMQNWGQMVDGLGFDIGYTAYVRADLLHRHTEQVDIFKNSGMVSAFFGIESFHPEGAKLVGKAWSGRESKVFLPELKKAWKNDVTFHISMIVGIPPEVEQDYRVHHDWCVDNQMHSWIWQTLGINTKSRTFESEFDRNYEQYGFTLVDPGNSKSWKTEHMTSEEAMRISTTLNNDPAKLDTVKLTSWGAMGMMSLGYSKEYLANTLERDVYKTDVVARQKQFIGTYKSLLRNL